MHVFFEDDGHFKAGTILADNDSSLQVEAATGKRLKIKAATVLLRHRTNLARMLRGTEPRVRSFGRGRERDPSGAAGTG